MLIPIALSLLAVLPVPVSAVDGEDPALAELSSFIAKKEIDTSRTGWKERLPMPPKVTSFSPDMDYLWKLETNKGPIVIRLLPDVAPMHVSSTIFLTQLGFYDDIGFHRVITGFMAQGGCPKGTGTGGPGYKYAGEFSDSVRHDRPGLLSMANAGPNTDGSQFFLTFVPTPHLDGKHTIFGEVVDGMKTVKLLEKSGSQTGKTQEKLLIEKATIEVVARPVLEEAATSDDPAFGALEAFAKEKGIDTGKRDWRTSLPLPPKQEFQKGKTYFWNLGTSEGIIQIKLLTETAPMHATSTIFLTRLGFYDGLTFHRVIDNFMAQGGCPLGMGSGGPGYEYAGEFEGDVKHSKAGMLSMANRGPNTDGSQFFITFAATPHLDGKHTIFGEVVGGMDVVKKLESYAGKNRANGNKPTKPLVIEKATISVQ